MNPKTFKKNILIYGSDVHGWPESIREAGLKALARSAELQAVLAQENHFESLLRTRKLEAPRDDLAERIVSASRQRHKKSRSGLGAFLSEVLWQFSLPKRALTAVSVTLVLALIVGFAIGFSAPAGTQSAEQYQASLEDFLYEGEVL
jgi:hypothetical protein